MLYDVGTVSALSRVGKQYIQVKFGTIYKIMLFQCVTVLESMKEEQSGTGKG